MKRSTKSKLTRRLIWLLAIACLAVGYFLSYSTRKKMKADIPPEVYSK